MGQPSGSTFYTAPSYHVATGESAAQNAQRQRAGPSVERCTAPAGSTTANSVQTTSVLGTGAQFHYCPDDRDIPFVI